MVIALVAGAFGLIGVAATIGHGEVGSPAAPSRVATEGVSAAGAGQPSEAAAEMAASRERADIETTTSQVPASRGAQREASQAADQQAAEQAVRLQAQQAATRAEREAVRAAQADIRTAEATEAAEAAEEAEEAEEEAEREAESAVEEEAEREEREAIEAIEDAQVRLIELGYHIGEIDGVVGPVTRSAVVAFQKVNQIEVDGVIGPQTRAALLDPVGPTLRGGPADRIEVDLTLQVVHLVQDGARVRTMHASSGNGELYLASSGRPVPALTPVGRFEIESRVEGVRVAALGEMHDPLYFHRGFAIHGSGTVPIEEASHGCVRLTIDDNRWLASQVSDGTAVILYGGEFVYAPPAGRTPGDDLADSAPDWSDAVAAAVDEAAAEDLAAIMAQSPPSAEVAADASVDDETATSG